MGSRSNATTSDTTTSTNSTTVVDRRVVQERGVQILDSVIASADDRVVGAALSEVRVMFDQMVNGNSFSVSKMTELVARLADMSNRNQIEMNRFGQVALDTARRELEALTNQGTFMLQISGQTIDKAMTMAEQITRDQAANQRQALEIVAQSKAGDYSETLTGISTLIMGFSLLAMIIARRK